MLDVYYRPKRFMSLDFETNSLEKGSALNPDNHIVLACWEIVEADGSVTKKHKWGDEYEMDELLEDIASVDFVVAHNAKFELQWLRRCGAELRDVLVFDTFLAEWVIAGNRNWQLGLEATATRYGLGLKEDIAARCIKMGIDPKDIPKIWLEPYCYRDTELARLIYYKQVEILRRDGLMHLVATRNLTCACLADIEFEGCELDVAAVKAEHEAAVSEFKVLDTQLHDITGGINLSSPKQLADYLYETLGFDIPKDHKGKPLLTGKGAPKTDNLTLAKLKATTDAQENFLKMYKRRNRLDSLITKNLEFFELVGKHNSGVFYGIFNQGFTGTHRLSSSGRPILFPDTKKPRGVQLQNLPREYKRLFTAHKDKYLVGEADGAQLEFRVAAEMGNDETATHEIITGADIHSVTAQVMIDNGHPEFKGLSVKEARQNAKSRTFAPMYGGMGKVEAEQEYSKFFKQKYSGISGTQRKWCLDVADRGFMINPYGMRFYWPGTKVSRSGYIENTTAISNYSIQGYATGEIIPIALVHFWHRTRNLDITVWNTIHDSIASRVHESCVDEYMYLSKRCLTEDVYTFLKDVYKLEFKVPLGVGVKLSKNWGTADTEHVWDVWPDGKEQYKAK